MSEHTLGTDACHYTWSPEHPSVLTVAPGDLIHFATRDGFDGQLNELTDGSFSTVPVDMSRVAPLTGPIHVESAEPGDTLVVKILDLQVAGDGWILTWPKWCGFDFHRPGGVPDEGRLRTVRHKEMVCGSFKIGSIAIPVKPMLGMIGTSPGLGETRTSPPGNYGGNLDCQLVGRSSVVRLPVSVAGAQLSFGDGHAAQGDGELCTTGVECPMVGVAQVWVEKQTGLASPQVVRDGRISVMSHGRTLEDAAKSAIERMVSHLVVDRGMDPESAYMAVSVAGDLAVNQVVNWPFVGMRLSMPTRPEESND